MFEQSGEKGAHASRVIRAEDAQEVAPATTADELVRFREQPTEDNLKLLLVSSLEQAYPWLTDHKPLIDWLDLDDRRPSTETKQFPVFPLSKMGGFETELIDALPNVAYPGSNVGKQIARLIARSDSALGHEVLAEHIVNPFPKELSKSRSGGNESQYKAELLMHMFSVINNIGSPGTNPHLIKTISTIYQGVRDGSQVFEQQKAKKLAEPNEFHGITTWELRNFQEWILGKCLESRHTALDSLVEESLAEPVDARRMATLIDVFGHRRHDTSRTDGFNERVIEHVAGGYNPLTVEIIKNIACTKDTVLSQPNRGWRRELVHAVIDTERQKQYPNGQLIHTVLWQYPIKQKLYQKDSAGNHSWPEDDKFEEDIAYMVSLLKDPNMSYLQGLITHHLAANDSRFHSYESRPEKEHVSRIYAAVIEAVLGTKTHDSTDAKSALGELSNLLNRTQRPFSEVPMEELEMLLEHWSAYREHSDRGDSEDYNYRVRVTHGALDPLLEEIRFRNGITG